MILRWFRRWQERRFQRMQDLLLTQREILEQHWREERGDAKPRLTREEWRQLEEKRARLSPEALAELKATGWDDMFDCEHFADDDEDDGGGGSAK